MSEHPVNQASVDPAGPVCWPAGLAAPMPRGQAEELATLFKAIADPSRLQIIALIGATPGGSACTCDLTESLELSQPTVSHHLKVLTDAGLLSREQRGTWAHYSLEPLRVRELANALEAAVAPQSSIEAR